MVKKDFSFSFEGQQLVVELGFLANLSTQSVLVKYGNSVVLTTLNYNDSLSNQDFFPLTIVFQEKLYSVGRIPGGFLKREGFPGEYATLCARLIDRSLRPLFTKGFLNEVQIVNNIFAVDENNDIRIAAAFASSLVACLSGLPFNGPTATVVIGEDNGKLIINPSQSQLSTSKLELVVGGTEDAINMVEAGCFEILENNMVEAIKLAHDNIKKLIGFQKEIINVISPKKIDYELVLIPEVINDFVNDSFYAEVEKLANISDKKERAFRLKEIFNHSKSKFYQEKNNINLNYDEAKIDSFINESIENLLKKIMRNNILVNNKRIDGRNVDEIRKLSSMIDILPVVHSSALFNRGETQVMSVLTLGTLNEHQIIDDLGKEDYKRFMHHYNFPPFSVGETGRFGKPSRREIGHGALGEKALFQILPNENDFPYTIRIVSEVLASNGSTSQAAICASSLALMAGGVPIKNHIAGIAMGLIKEEEKYAVLTDIQGLEDHLGDMDFKIAGTINGICALQMDIKIKGLDFNILQEALQKAKIARLKVLENMNQVISEPRKTVAQNAPKILKKSIPVDKIREVIGSQGKVINKIISESDNVKIDIEEDGTILIYHNDQSTIEKAWKMIEEILNPKQILENDEFKGKVIKITDFGAFVNLKDNVDGLIHISQFSKLFNKRIDNLANLIKINDVFHVKVAKVEPNGKLRLEIINENNN